jgi:branched-chain amino acid transport system substrate-binding protein
MKTTVAVFRGRIGEDRRRRAVGTDTEGLALKPIQEPDATNRHILFDFMTSIWCSAMVGCIGAALIAPQNERNPSMVEMKMRNDRHWLTVAAAAGIVAVVASPAAAQKKYDPGASDGEIKIGSIMPYSGPLSAYAEIGKTEAAYFQKINAEGGINRRKINFISYDDGYSPPKTVEQTRKLVESDEILLIFQSMGTPTNTAIQRYMNAKKVPQLFVATGASKWNDPQHFPWTMGWGPNYQSEARIYAQYLLKNHPQGKIGILYQNDDYGKDYLKGLKDGLNGKMQIVAEAPYETSDPTVDSQIINLKASGADIFFNFASAKFAA